MTLLRSAAAAAAGPCSLGLFIRRLSSSSSSFSTRRRPPTYACPYKYTHTYAAASPSSSPWLLSRRRGFSASASSASGPGPIDSPMMQTMENKIKEQLEAEMVIVRDAYGDGRHVCIDVVSKAFEGKSPVNRQRMVYKAIWEELQTTVHAVDQMTTKTPAEAAADN